MKKILLFNLLILNFIGFSQEFEVTQNGLKNKSNIENGFLVISASKKSTNQLYQNAIEYVNGKPKELDRVIKEEIENEYLLVETTIPQFMRVNNSGEKLDISIKYSTELKFKNGKVRYEITKLDMSADNRDRKLSFKGNIWIDYPIYDQKGKLRLKATKTNLENYFNSQVKELTEFLTGEKTNEDDW
ncbi:MAG: DUF4468 domain-containing protein [Flavobacteriaceae bacterium]|nr:DUF4468 domain-containing protein [Flavobacteriaceae bacterium]